MTENSNYLGYFKYHGRLVEAGFMDARKSAEALLGLDEILRHFVLKDKPSFRDLDFEIPVRIRKGSWEALIPDTIGQWIYTGGGIIATTYLANAARKMAEKDFADVGLKDVFRGALKSTQWAIKIGIHSGTLAKKKFDNVKFRKDTQEIGIPNDQKEYLYVPKLELERFSELPEDIFSKNTALVEEERALSIGVYDGERVEEVTINYREKAIFYREEATEEILFPELRHGQRIELEGNLTRGNKRSNTLGFEYQGHVLTCLPHDGSVVRFKAALFLKAKILGIVDRTDKFGHPVAKRPKIIIEKIQVVEVKEDNLKLF